MGRNRVFIIAEAGVNHNGSLPMALKLIDAAKEACADAVKFQTFTSEAVISCYAKKANYQIKTTGAQESQLEMVKKLELGPVAHRRILDRCKKRGVRFLSTPFDEASVDFLVTQLKVPLLKIPSGEITNGPLLLRVAQTQKPVILSTGMSTLNDVREGLGVLAFGYLGLKKKPSKTAFQVAFQSIRGQRILRKRVALLQCTTEYPCPYEDVNLLAMDVLADTFGLTVGLSDHSQGIHVPIGAVARGACIIEKHMTLDRTLPGPDHKASLEPSQFAAMVRGIRDVEKALGLRKKSPASSEIKNIPIARKSLVAAKFIKKGEIFTLNNLTSKRPGDGISPMNFWNLLGKTSDRDYAVDDPIHSHGN